MEKYTLTVTDEIEPAFEQVIAGGLNRFNDEMTGYNDRQPLAVIVRDTQRRRRWAAFSVAHRWDCYFWSCFIYRAARQRSWQQALGDL